SKLNKKIRWRGDRTDEFVGGTHGRDLTSTGEFALDEKGRVQAYRVRSIGATGAYCSGTANVIPLVLGPFRADRRLRPPAGALRDQDCDDPYRAGRRLSRSRAA